MSELRGIRDWSEWCRLWDEFHDERKLEPMAVSLLHHLPQAIKPYYRTLNNQLIVESEQENGLTDFFDALEWVMSLVIHEPSHRKQDIDAITAQARKTAQAMMSHDVARAVFGSPPFQDHEEWLSTAHIRLITTAVEYCACPWAYYDGKEPISQTMRDTIRSIIHLMHEGAGGDDNLAKILREAGRQDLLDVLPQEYWSCYRRSWQTPTICRALVNVGLPKMLEEVPSEIGFEVVKTARDINFGVEKRETGGKWVMLDDHWYRLGRNSQELHRTLTVIGHALQKPLASMDWPE